MKKHNLIFGALVFSGACTFHAHAGDINLVINTVKHDTGFVMIALYDQAEGFPNKAEPIESMKLKAQKGNMTAVFKDRDAGVYAISFFHDKNGNGKLDANLLGKPVEPYGFSENARGTFGPPDFKAASFKVVEGEEVTILKADLHE